MDRSGYARIPDLFEALMTHRDRHCTDPQDKIYALVGLTVANDDPDFVERSTSTQRTICFVVLNNWTSLAQQTRGTDRLDLPRRVSNLGFDSRLTGTMLHNHHTVHQEQG
jgi:hypothetical protein